jgi:hypothetical protein
MTAEVLGFADTAGETMIKQMVDKEMVKQCRQSCNLEYPV